MKLRNLIVGSRASELALVQTNAVIQSLLSLSPDLQIHVEKIVTKGDRILNQTLSKIGGKGLFVKEIEQALLEKRIDFAVHSMKDLPGEMPEGLIIAAITKREDARDCLLSRSQQGLMDLPSGAIVGTSSLRRQAQILALRPDVHVQPVRGNIHTRIRKMEEGQFDAIVLAVAGLERMGWLDKIAQVFSVKEMLPSVGQGALAIQCRAEDAECIPLLQKLHHEETARTVTAERSFLRSLNGDCHVPVGALARIIEEEVSITGLVAAKDGKHILKSSIQGTDEWRIGKELAAELIDQGAEQLLNE